MFDAAFHNDPRFRLPQPWWKTDTQAVTATDHLRKRFQHYLADLRRMLTNYSGPPSFRQRMERVVESTDSVCKGILETLHLLLHGQRAQAFAVFNAMCSEQDKRSTGYPVITLSAEHPLFRARASDSALDTKGELFHIPFEKRGRVTSQRYSIPGLPCLYFGETLYGCWVELGKPPLDQMYYSRFSATGSPLIKVVDLDYDLCDLVDRGDHIEKVVPESDGTYTLMDGPGGGWISKIVWWPLLAACSLLRYDPKQSFHEEYLMPHLFMEYLLHEERLAGVRYFSCRGQLGARSRRQVKSALMNIAIPTRKQALAGFCSDMVSAFHMTDPLSWRLMDAIGEYDWSAPDLNTVTSHSQFQTSANNTTSYYQTLFFALEMRYYMQQSEKVI